jgi:hypothetical protein
VLRWTNATLALGKKTKRQTGALSLSLEEDQ